MTKTQKDQADRLVDELGLWLEQYFLARKGEVATVEKTTTASQLERDVLNYMKAQREGDEE